jgi:L-lactate dehydrogenase
MSRKLMAWSGNGQRPKRIAIIGCRNVAPESVYSLGLSRAVDEVLLIGDGGQALRSEVLGLIRSFPAESTFRIFEREPNWSERTDIVIVAVGETRDAGGVICGRVARHSMLVRRAIEDIMPLDRRGLLLITTSPVDEMTEVAQEASGLPPERVIGVGGVSPWGESSARRQRKKGQAAAVWCSAMGSGGQFMDSCRPDCPYFEGVLSEFSQIECGKVMTEKPEALASCVMQVCNAILRDEPSVLTVSAKARGEYGIWDVYMTLPCVISRSGVERVIEFKGNQDRQPLLDYARELSAIRRELNTVPPAKPVKIADQPDRDVQNEESSFHEHKA